MKGQFRVCAICEFSSFQFELSMLRAALRRVGGAATCLSFPLRYVASTSQHLNVEERVKGWMASRTVPHGSVCTKALKELRVSKNWEMLDAFYFYLVEGPPPGVNLSTFTSIVLSSAPARADAGPSLVHNVLKKLKEAGETPDIQAFTWGAVLAVSPSSFQVFVLEDVLNRMSEAGLTPTDDMFSRVIRHSPKVQTTLDMFKKFKLEMSSQVLNDLIAAHVRTKNPGAARAAFAQLLQSFEPTERTFHSMLKLSTETEDKVEHFKDICRFREKANVNWTPELLDTALEVAGQLDLALMEEVMFTHCDGLKVHSGTFQIIMEACRGTPHGLRTARSAVSFLRQHCCFETQPEHFNMWLAVAIDARHAGEAKAIVKEMEAAFWEVPEEIRVVLASFKEEEEAVAEELEQCNEESVSVEEKRTVLKKVMKRVLEESWDSPVLFNEALQTVHSLRSFDLFHESLSQLLERSANPVDVYNFMLQDFRWRSAGVSRLNTVLNEAVQSALPLPIETWNIALETLFTHHADSDAEKVAQLMTMQDIVPNASTLDIIVRACCTRSHGLQLGERFLQVLWEQIPTVLALESTMALLFNFGEWEKADEAFRQFSENSVPSSKAFSRLFDTCRLRQDGSTVHIVNEQMREMAVHPCRHSFSSLLVSLAFFEDSSVEREAYRMFQHGMFAGEDLEQKLRSFTGPNRANARFCHLASHLRHREDATADLVSTFERLHQPDTGAVAHLMQVMFRQGNLEAGDGLHRSLVEENMELSPFAWHVLIESGVQRENVESFFANLLQSMGTCVDQSVVRTMARVSPSALRALSNHSHVRPFFSDPLVQSCLNQS